MLSSNEVALLLGYRNRQSFWATVVREGVPHVRITARNIRFPAAALNDWIARRTVGKGAK